MDPRNMGLGTGKQRTVQVLPVGRLQRTWHMRTTGTTGRILVLLLATYEALRWSLRLPAPAFPICDVKKCDPLQL